MSRYTGRGPEAFVFTTTRGQRLSTTAFTKSVKKGFASVGKPGMRVHDLRHVGATMVSQAGATTKELMGRVGHSSVNASMYQTGRSQMRCLAWPRRSWWTYGSRFRRPWGRNRKLPAMRPSPPPSCRWLCAVYL